MERTVFINYRGEDSHSYGALLYWELAQRFGEDQVFLDAESIPAGADFVQELLGRVRSAWVLLAVIGQRWLTAVDDTGRRRIDDPADWIRRELAEAFAANVRVIPVLTDQAVLPSDADLPADIAPLSRCQYRHLRRREPKDGLARLVVDLTSLNPVLAAAARSRDNTPRQLPAAPGLFTGRAVELAALTDFATRTAPDAGTTVAISAIGGSGGIGKTALALHWAYQQLHRFPDGQLYVNLRGFDPSGQPMSAGEAVHGFLTSLGVDPATLPEQEHARLARYRSLVAGKRMLIVLDNVRDVDQVMPLVPGTPSCMVLVTSRRRLTGLALHGGAGLIDLDVLPESEARSLFARHLGPERLDAEPEAVADLLTVCAGLPLAVRIVAARAAEHPTFSLAVLAEELRDVSARLDGLDAGDLHGNVSAVLSWSSRALNSQAARLFKLLGIAPGLDIGLPAAASLIALPEGQVRAVLRELEHASLVQQPTPGRYRMHDLVRLYATNAARRDLTEEMRDAALRQVLHFYTYTAHATQCLLEPYTRPILLDPPGAGVCPWPLPDTQAAMAWLDTEHPVLLAAQQAAASHGWHRIVWQLACGLHGFHFRRGHRHERLNVWQAALDAALRVPDPILRIVAHRRLGHACAYIGYHQEAVSHLKQAIVLAHDHHDIDQQASANRVLAWALGRQGDDRQALEYATRALDLYRTIHQPHQPIWEANALSAMGWHAARLGEYNTARTYCQDALTLVRSHAGGGGGNELHSLGYIAHHTGHHDQAVDYYQQALADRRAGDHVAEAADTLDGLGHPHVALGQYNEARAIWREALQLYQQQGRDEDAARVQQQLDDLDKRDGGMPAGSVME